MDSPTFLTKNKRDSGPRRPLMIGIHVSATEYEVILRDADAAGLSMAAYARQLMLKRGRLGSAETGKRTATG